MRGHVGTGLQSQRSEGQRDRIQGQAGRYLESLSQTKQNKKQLGGVTAGGQLAGESGHPPRSRRTQHGALGAASSPLGESAGVWGLPKG